MLTTDCRSPLFHLHSIPPELYVAPLLDFADKFSYGNTCWDPRHPVLERDFLEMVVRLAICCSLRPGSVLSPVDGMNLRPGSVLSPVDGMNSGYSPGRVAQSSAYDVVFQFLASRVVPLCVGLSGNLSVEAESTCIPAFATAYYDDTVQDLLRMYGSTLFLLWNSILDGSFSGDEV